MSALFYNPLHLHVHFFCVTQVDLSCGNPCFSVCQFVAPYGSTQSMGKRAHSFGRKRIKSYGTDLVSVPFACKNIVCINFFLRGVGDVAPYKESKISRVFCFVDKENVFSRVIQNNFCRGRRPRRPQPNAYRAQKRAIRESSALIFVLTFSAKCAMI